MVIANQINLLPTGLLTVQGVERSFPSEGTLCVRIPIRVMGKPSMSRSDKWEKRPRVQRYWRQCDLIREAFGITLMNRFLWADRLMVTAKFGTRVEELWGKPHREKPDADNIYKGVCDALFKEDEMIYFAQSCKYWGRSDCVEITVEGLK